VEFAGAFHFRVPLYLSNLRHVFIHLGPLVHESPRTIPTENQTLQETTGL